MFRVPFIILTTLLALASAACGGGDRYVLIGDASAASTAGILEVAEDDDGSDVTLHLEFLAAPGQRDPALTHYAVWFVTKQGHAEHGGSLAYDSKQRTGDLQLRGPALPFEVLVTAETTSDPKQPSEYRILAQAVTED